MTAKQIYEYVLIELNKIQAPSMLLEDFNYFINKAVNQYINKKYNIYDVNQQSTDDLRVLKATAIIPVGEPTTAYGSNTAGVVTSANSLYGAAYEINLPNDYLHMLNCVCNYYVNKDFKCYDANTYVQFPATRLTADLWGLIINNFYMRPSYKKPYYYIHNVNTLEALPTNPIKSLKANSFKFYHMSTDWFVVTFDSDGITYTITERHSNINYLKIMLGTEEITLKLVEGLIAVSPSIKGNTFRDGDNVTLTMTLDGTGLVGYKISRYSEESYDLSSGTDPNFIGNNQITFGRNIKVGDKVTSLVEKSAGVRYGNTSKVRCEIRTGKDSSLFLLKQVYIDYIKTPLFIRLTQELIDLVEDTSLELEFPDYACQEIINELTHLVQENSSDPRLLSHMPIVTSIANPAQQLEK